VQCALRWCGWQAEDELDAALEHWRWDYDFGEAPARLSLRHNCAEEFTRTDYDESDWVAADPRGFASVARHLAAGVFSEGDPRLLLGTRVTRIERSDRGGVLVVSSDGRVRVAKIVLLTVSVGVLQSSAIRFVPELPLSKLRPLHDLAMGAYTRVYLAFPSKFWPEEQRHILIAHPRRGHYAVVTVMGTEVTRYPPAEAHMLCVTVTGDEARRVDALADDEVTAEVTSLFRDVWGEQPVPAPLSVRVCRWTTDPDFCGAYSVIPPHALQGGFAQLQEPVGPIHFAGEAFHERYSGFLHGAFLSGEDAARRIVAALESAEQRDRAQLMHSPLFKNIGTVKTFTRPGAGGPTAEAPRQLHL